MADELRLACSYQPLPPQWAFRLSTAKIRGYGGAMAGGKTRAMCEEAFDLALEHPGILLPLFRQKHTAITNTTRKTFFEQVLPAELRDHCRVKNSGGEDYCRLWNGSEIHFVGLDDPIKWHSAEIGAVGFDEAHEIAEQDVLTLITRLRQRCRDCLKARRKECPHMPRRAMLAFNPAQPGHWLQHWFILGASPTEHGFLKEALYASEAEEPLGDCEFIFARAADNPFLPPGYIEQTLSGLPVQLRRRYLEGRWEHIGDSCFFDVEALAAYEEEALAVEPILVGRTEGETLGKGAQRIRLARQQNGPLVVFSAPVRERDDPDDPEGRPLPAHRYVVAVDAASGTAQDWSACQVVSVDDCAQVAELQVKLDPDQLAVEAFRLAAVYNGALIVPEVTGGWGFAVAKHVQGLQRAWRGNPQAKPRLYTRPVIDRISQRWTDRLGFDTNLKTRAHVLATLEQAIRERSVAIPGRRTLAELAAFVYEPRPSGEYGKPQARASAHDDLTMALAIGVTVALSQPKALRTVVTRPRRPALAATGY